MVMPALGPAGEEPAHIANIASTIVLYFPGSRFAAHGTQALLPRQEPEEKVGLRERFRTPRHVYFPRRPTGCLRNQNGSCSSLAAMAGSHPAQGAERRAESPVGAPALFHSASPIALLPSASCSTQHTFTIPSRTRSFLTAYSARKSQRVPRKIRNARRVACQDGETRSVPVR